jgi:cephalosporin-C deacetylase-like acetyl esterase
MGSELEEFKYYPSQKEVDDWVDEIWKDADKANCKVELMNQHEYGAFPGIRHIKGCRFVKFSIDKAYVFYAYWQSAPSGPAPLLVHVPGYGAEMSIHPDLVMQGYNVLHISPLGYTTPSGYNESKKSKDVCWPVLPDSVRTKAQKGYKQWLMNCVIAIKWAQSLRQVLQNRVSFFGTSQGGGGSLLLGSVYKNKGVRCVAADVPFLTNFPLAKKLNVSDAYKVAAFDIMETMKDKKEAWYGMGFIDTISHAHRLTVPVMLTAGGSDLVCPPPTVQALFEKLPTTRMYYYLDGQGHEYTQHFIALATAWFRLYA